VVIVRISIDQITRHNAVRGKYVLILDPLKDLKDYKRKRRKKGGSECVRESESTGGEGELYLRFESSQAVPSRPNIRVTLLLTVGQCLGVEWSDVCYCWTVIVLSLEGALSDEKAGQSFVSSSNWQAGRQLIYDRQSVGQSVLVSGAHLGLLTRVCFLLEISFRQLRVCNFVAPSLTRGLVCKLL
jgi:hypothetical protein